MLAFEGHTGQFRLLGDKCGEINVSVTAPDQTLNELMHNRGYGHWDLAFARGCQSEAGILAEQPCGECRLEIEVTYAGDLYWVN